MSALLELLFDLLMGLGWGKLWKKLNDTPSQGRTLAEQTFNEKRRRFVVFGISGLLLLLFALYTLRSAVDRWSLQAGNTDLLSLSGDAFWGGLALLAAFSLFLESLGWPDEFGLPPLKRPYESRSNPGILELLSDVEAKRREAAAKRAAREQIKDEQIIRALEILEVDDPVDYVRDAARNALQTMEIPIVEANSVASAQTATPACPPSQATPQIVIHPPASFHAPIPATSENKGNWPVRLFRWYKGVIARGLGLASMYTALINVVMGASLIAFSPVAAVLMIVFGIIAAMLESDPNGQMAVIMFLPVIPLLLLAVAVVTGCLAGIVLGFLGIFEPIWRRPFPLQNSFFGLGGLVANLSILLFDFFFVVIGLGM